MKNNPTRTTLAIAAALLPGFCLRQVKIGTQARADASHIVINHSTTHPLRKFGVES